jgi:Transposase DDE domain
MDGFDASVLTRLPLVEASAVVLGHVLEPGFLNAVFEEHRQRAYTDVLEFPTLVQLIADALTQYHGRARQSFQAAEEVGRMSVGARAVYAKLGRLPIPVSEALLAAATARLRRIRTEASAVVLPASLDPYHVIVFDGKKLKRLSKRLKPLRGVSGKLLGGKLLVALSVREGLAVAMSATADGEANDVPLVEPLIPQVRSRIAGPRLWVGDRQFSDLTLPLWFIEDNDAFVIRHSKSLSFQPDPERPAHRRQDLQNHTIVDEWGWLGKSKGDRPYVRRVTLMRPAEKEDVVLLTSLLNDEQIPAKDLLSLYAERWGIERMFQKVTEVFQLQQLIGSTPEGAVFQGALCLLLYNVLEVLRGYVAQGQGLAAEAVSSEMLFTSLTREWVTATTLGVEAVAQTVGSQPRPPEAVRTYLSERLSGVWQPLWRKCPNKTRWKPPDQQRIRGGHSSAWKLLQTARNNPKPPPQ